VLTRSGNYRVRELKRHFEHMTGRVPDARKWTFIQ